MTIWIIPKENPPKDNDDSSLLPPPPTPLAGVVMVSSGLIAFAGILAYSEPSRIKFFTLLIPLYTRLKGDDIETLQNRKEILGFIKGRPGANYSTIMHALEIGNGTLTYHLKVLEENRVIKSRTEGNRKLFYPHRYQIAEKRDRIIELLKVSPGLNQRDIVRILRMSRRKTGRKLSELVGEGKVRIQKIGRENHYYLTGAGERNGAGRGRGFPGGMNGNIRGGGGGGDGESTTPRSLTEDDT
jgi:DNA-binding transcriptional ArsR family regulator